MLASHYIREIKNGDGRLAKEFKKHLDDKRESKIHKEKYDHLIEEIAKNQVYVELCDDLLRRISLYDPSVRTEIIHILFHQMHNNWIVHWGGEGPHVKIVEIKEEHEKLFELFEITGLKDELKDDAKEKFEKIIHSEVIQELVKSVIPFSGVVVSIGKGLKNILKPV